jgi:hypothetical protein
LTYPSCEDTDFNGEGHEKCAFIVREALVGELDVQSQIRQIGPKTLLLADYNFIFRQMEINHYLYGGL